MRAEQPVVFAVRAFRQKVINAGGILAGVVGAEQAVVAIAVGGALEAVGYIVQIGQAVAVIVQPVGTVCVAKGPLRPGNRLGHMKAGVVLLVAAIHRAGIRVGAVFGLSWVTEAALTGVALGAIGPVFARGAVFEGHPLAFAAGLFAYTPVASIIKVAAVLWAGGANAGLAVVVDGAGAFIITPLSVRQGLVDANRILAAVRGARIEVIAGGVLGAVKAIGVIQIA